MAVSDLPPMNNNIERYARLEKLGEGTYAHIAACPGLAVKHGVTVLADAINESGEIRIILHNSDPSRAFVIRRWYKIAQLFVVQTAS